LPTHKQKNKKNALKVKLHNKTISRKATKAKSKHTKTPKHNVKRRQKPIKVQKKTAKALRKEREELFAKNKIIEDTKQAASLLENKAFKQHITGKVGPEAPVILRELIKSPKTDEDIATQLNIKVNDIRRALNLMNGYGIVKYDVNKDSKGWLIFKWRLNNEKLEDYINNVEIEIRTVEQPTLPGNCNDFFICKKCYSEQKVVHPFDSAFESGFNCESCGKPYVIMNKEETIALFQEATVSK
jgi:transcription factor E